MIVFACLSPHPPILLPSVGSPTDREKVRSTITALEFLAPKLAEAKPKIIIVSSPHPDWGISVPLHFLARNFQLPISNFQSITNFQFSNLHFVKNFKLKIKNSPEVFPILTTLDSPKDHFHWGKEIASIIPEKLRVAWIASGDMSHVLKEDGPYGFNSSGPKFDQKFIELLKQKDVEGILNLDPQFTEEAAECGLRSFCMLLGALEWQANSSGLKTRSTWTPKILSYEDPFGVGYLVVGCQVENTKTKL